MFVLFFVFFCVLLFCFALLFCFLLFFVILFLLICVLPVACLVSVNLVRVEWQFIKTVLSRLSIWSGLNNSSSKLFCHVWVFGPGWLTVHQNCSVTSEYMVKDLMKRFLTFSLLEVVQKWKFTSCNSVDD